MVHTSLSGRQHSQILIAEMQYTNASTKLKQKKTSELLLMKNLFQVEQNVMLLFFKLKGDVHVT